MYCYCHALGQLICVIALVLPERQAPMPEHVYAHTHTGVGEQMGISPATIRFLEKEDRLNVEEPPASDLVQRIPEPIRPAEEADNPVLYADRFARFRFANTTQHPIRLYALAKPLLGESTLDHTGIVRVSIRDESGQELQPPPNPLRSLDPLTVPSAETLIRDNYPTFTLKPDEFIEFPMSILGDITSPRQGLKPGTYTVRATLSYAVAPSGEPKQITSPPVTVKVTEAHIKAAVEFWNKHYPKKPK